MLSKNLSKPPIWRTQASEVEEIELPSYNSEYKHIRSKLTAESLNYLKKITRVQNPYLYHRYNLRKLEYEYLGIPYMERELVHATAASNIPSIIQDNLDWRRVSRAKFGQGVSFSTCPSYANKYCARANGPHRAMIVAKVLVGRQHQGSFSTKVALKGFDTAIGNRGKVIVKFYDDEFYPAYVAYYDNGVVHRNYVDYDDIVVSDDGSYDDFYDDYYGGIRDIVDDDYYLSSD